MPATLGLIDTNILIYAFETGPKSAIAQALLEDGHIVSVQGLTEFVRNARRKLKMSWADTIAARDQIIQLASAIIPVDVDVHREGVRLTQRYTINLFDGVMLAAALRGGCAILWSEDLHDGLHVDDRLRIVNPFRA